MSRLESHGSPGKIQVSEAVYDGLHDRYRFSQLHLVDLKGKGPTAARFLLGRNGDAESGPSGKGGETRAPGGSEFRTSGKG